MTMDNLNPDLMAASRLVDEIEALHEKATPGPWQASGAHIDARDDINFYVVAKHQRAAANVALIAAVVNAWPQIRDTLRSLLSSRESVRAAVVEGGKLLPCPFCSADRGRMSVEHDPDGIAWHFVECGSCRVRTRGKWVSRGNDCPQFYQEVRDEWNRRPLAAQSPNTEK